MEINKIREQFEAALVTKLVRELCDKAPGLPADAAEIIIRSQWLERKGDGYAAPVPDHGWWAWQASRGAVLVQLPKPDDSFDNHEYLIDRQLTVKAIEYCGLKVAP